MRERLRCNQAVSGSPIDTSQLLSDRHENGHRFANSFFAPLTSFGLLHDHIIDHSLCRRCEHIIYFRSLIIQLHFNSVLQLQTCAHQLAGSSHEFRPSRRDTIERTA